MTNMIIEAQNVSVSLGERTVIDNASLTCVPGTMTALVGPSGSGKTTLLHCLGLLQTPTAGQVLAGGVDTTDWSSPRRRRFWRDQCAFILQDYGIMEEESVAFNVTMASRVLGLGRRADPSRLRSVLQRTGLSGRDDEPAGRLSGGEKQRLSVARAMYKDATVILVDEPTASLDAANRALVIGLFADLARQERLVIVASHDDELIEACSSRFSVARAADTPSATGATQV